MLIFVFLILSLLFISIVLGEINYKKIVSNKDLYNANLKSKNNYSAKHIVDHFLIENKLEQHIKHLDSKGFPSFSPFDKTIYMPLGFAQSVNYYHTYMWLHEYTHYIQSLNRVILISMKLFIRVVEILKLINYLLIGCLIVRFSLSLVLANVGFPKEYFYVYLLFLSVITLLLSLFKIAIEFHAYWKPLRFLEKHRYITPFEKSNLRRFAINSLLTYIIAIPNLLFDLKKFSFAIHSVKKFSLLEKGTTYK